MKPEKPKVVDLGKRRYRNMVLNAYDKLERAEDREKRVAKSEVERDARKRW
jgi:hypothetical protein